MQTPRDGERRRPLARQPGNSAYAGYDGDSKSKYTRLTYPLSLVMAAIAYLQEELDLRRASGEATRKLVQVLPLVYAGYSWLADLAAAEESEVSA